MAFYSFYRRIINPSIKPWGYVLPTTLGFYPIANTMVTADSHTQKGVKYEGEITGSGAPRLIYTRDDFNDWDNVAIKAKVISYGSTISSGWWGFGFGVLRDPSLGTDHAFLGLHTTGAATLFAHYLRYTWDINSGSGWASNNSSLLTQTAPFWIACKIVGTTFYFYQSIDDGATWSLRHSATTGITWSEVKHFGFMFHTLNSVSLGTISVELDNISIGDATGL